MSAAIDMVPRGLPGNPYSHTGSWAFLRANQFKHVDEKVDVITKNRDLDAWSDYDTIYLYHTMDFDAKHPYLLNIFDGPQEHVAKYFERFIWERYKDIKLISLDYPMPDYGYRCKRKRDRASEDTKMSQYWKDVDWDAVQAKCLATSEWVLDPGVVMLNPITFAEYQAGGKPPAEEVVHVHAKLTMGDSHTPSVYTPKSLILRKDGRTLNGILKKGIQKEVTDYGYDWKQIIDLTCYWGNIDIRHHLCREDDPADATIKLVDRYAEELKRTGKNIEVICPIPIEDESRVLPSTGLYQGTTFFGTRAQRQAIVDVFSNRLAYHAAQNNWKIFRWPEHWYTMDGVEFMETVMERPRSVHLARKFYRWDLENDILNPLSQQQPTRAKLLEF